MTFNIFCLCGLVAILLDIRVEYLGFNPLLGHRESIRLYNNFKYPLVTYIHYCRPNIYIYYLANLILPVVTWDCYCLSIYLFVFLRSFQHCTGHITTGSWKDRGNQYIQFVRVLYCKLPINGKQLPAFPLESMPEVEPRAQRWEARVLPLNHRAPYCLSSVGAQDYGVTVLTFLAFNRAEQNLTFKIFHGLYIQNLSTLEGH